MTLLRDRLPRLLEDSPEGAWLRRDQGITPSMHYRDVIAWLQENRAGPVSRPAAPIDQWPHEERRIVDPTPEQFSRGCTRAASQISDANDDIGQPWLAWTPMLVLYEAHGLIEPHHRDAGEKMLDLGIQAGRRDLVSHRSSDGLRRGQGNGAAIAALELREIERAIGPRYLKAVDMLVFKNLRAPAAQAKAGLDLAARHLGIDG